jgi:hypothetical protein
MATLFTHVEMFQGERADPLPMSLTGDEIAGLQPCRAWHERSEGEQREGGQRRADGLRVALALALLWRCFGFALAFVVLSRIRTYRRHACLRRTRCSLVAPLHRFTSTPTSSPPTPSPSILCHPSTLHHPPLPSPVSPPSDGLLHRLHRLHRPPGTQAQDTAPATFGLLSRSTVQLLPSLAAWTCPSSSTLHQPPFLHLIC